MLTPEKYRAVNSSFRDELIFRIGMEAGFYSEYNNMLLAMLDCLISRRRFVLYSRYANFGYSRGWTDFFLPFCDEVRGRFHRRFNRRWQSPMDLARALRHRLRVKFYRYTHPHTLLTNDVFERVRGERFRTGSRIEVPAAGISGSPHELLGQLVRITYRFNEPTRKRIDALLATLELPEKYVGFHIRGGDKFVEYPQLETARYIAKAEALTSLREGFVFTDDYRILESMRRDFPGWKFHTLTRPEERGYFHDAFSKSDTSMKTAETIKMFASMEALRNSEIFVGTFSSNPGMFLGMVHQRAYGVDFDR
ncbi:MAG: hypothetical protein LBU95_00765 [Rikenellaceae bacterium]|jgi:hypothetical protein|nr:hypothetical protein [Rikenellaceae bacterium]